MNFTKTLFGAALGCATAIGSVQAADVTLLMHHFLSPAANAHKVMLQGWADDVAEASGGKIEFQIFPSMSMGGKPPELYSQVRDGTADIIWTVLGYTPGVFTRTEVFELPTVHRGSAVATTTALNASFDMLAEDFEDVHVLFLHAHEGNVLHSAAGNVANLADAAGMKLRTPSRTGAWLIEELGAEPVSMPVPALPEAMSKGVVDGTLIPYEIVPALKLQELDKHVTELPEGDRFGTSVFMLAMNKDVYEGLDDDLKAVLNAHSRSNVAAQIGQMWAEFEADGLNALASKNIAPTVPSTEESAKFEAAGLATVDRWIAEANSSGLDGTALVEAARAAVAAAQ